MVEKAVACPRDLHILAEPAVLPRQLGQLAPPGLLDPSPDRGPGQVEILRDRPTDRSPRWAPLHDLGLELRA